MELDEDLDSSDDKNDGRFVREFCDVKPIGSGQFSTVYRARNQVDQCLYAVKKTKPISPGLRQAQQSLREVFALASVTIEAEGCPNIVRYFSSWVEDGRLHIQTELCEGSLRDRLGEFRRSRPSDPRFGAEELAEVLRDVASGLTVLHGSGFAHLYIKPDNILIGRGCYKIADLGLATAAMGSGCDTICEGDCRYLAREILRGNLGNLMKADVFSLGLVCYELATNPKALPCNGDEWQRLREGLLDISLLPSLPEPLLALLLRMVHSDIAERPPATEVARHESVARSAEPGDLQEMREAVRQKQLEADTCKRQAEKSQRQAETYWQEMMQMKKKELLDGGAAPAATPPPPALTRYRTA